MNNTAFSSSIISTYFRTRMTKDDYEKQFYKTNVKNKTI